MLAKQLLDTEAARLTRLNPDAAASIASDPAAALDYATSATAVPGAAVARSATTAVPGLAMGWSTIRALRASRRKETAWTRLLNSAKRALGLADEQLPNALPLPKPRSQMSLRTAKALASIARGRRFSSTYSASSSCRSSDASPAPSDREIGPSSSTPSFDQASLEA